jgi:integrase
MHRLVDGKPKWNGLGRMPRSEVGRALEAAWRELDPYYRDSPIEPSGDEPLEATPAVDSVVKLCRMWYAAVEDRRANPVAENTLKNYRWACERIRDAGIGSLDPARLSDDNIIAFVEQLKDPKFRQWRWDKQVAAAKAKGRPVGGVRPNGRCYSVNVINHTLQILSIILAWARGREESLGVKVPSVQPTAFRIRQKPGQEERVYRSHIPSTEELEEFCAELDSPVLRAAVEVAWRCGLRPGEMVALRWCDLVQTPHGWLLLAGNNPHAQENRKTGARRVPAPKGIAARLRTIRPDEVRQTDLIFGGASKKVLGNALVEAQEDAGRPLDRQFSFKCLRSRWSFDMVAAGVPLQVYRDISGHTIQTAIKHYARVTDEHRQAALLKVQESEQDEKLWSFLAARGVTTIEAIELLRQALDERVARSDHLALAPTVSPAGQKASDSR